MATTRADDPTRHTREVQRRLSDLISYLRDEVHDVEDAQAKALFETAAETLGGLKEAFEDYEEGDEAAWEE